METIVEQPEIASIYAWVKSKHPEAVVGCCRHPFDCIISNYLRETYPGLAFSVELGMERIQYIPDRGPNPRLTYEEMHGAAPSVCFPMESEAYQLAKRFDALYTDYNLPYKYVTAREALGLFAAIGMED